jgi:hypothetical protein|tara:strand:+ start:995 stop:1171 length:177 start_codon:yes stop_codon:yes gene_type:complete
MKTQIEIIWTVDDIRSLGYECTNQQGMKVLNFIKEYHDRDYGINWATIDNACESFGLK